MKDEDEDEGWGQREGGGGGGEERGEREGGETCLYDKAIYTLAAVVLFLAMIWFTI